MSVGSKRSNVGKVKMNDDRAALIQSLRARVAYESDVGNYKFSVELREDIFAFLATCKNNRRGCELIGFSRNTLRNWRAERKKEKDE